MHVLIGTDTSDQNKYTLCKGRINNRKYHTKSNKKDI